jgi:hypothetical protein
LSVKVDQESFGVDQESFGVDQESFGVLPKKVWRHQPNTRRRYFFSVKVDQESFGVAEESFGDTNQPHDPVIFRA